MLVHTLTVDTNGPAKRPELSRGIRVTAATAADLKAAQSTAPDPLRDFGFLLRDLARLNTLNFERHAAAAGSTLTLSQCRVLTYLQRNEGISKARLAELTGTDPMTLGRLLARMTADGLVDQRIDATDRRAHRLYLKPDRALPLLDEIWRSADKCRAEALVGLEPAERTQLMTLLRRVQENLDTLMPGEADRGTPAAKRG